MSLPPGRLHVQLRKELRGYGEKNFLLDVKFVAQAGVTVIFGASGAGKSTLLDSIAGLLTPDSGRVSVSAGAQQEILFDSAGAINLPVERRRLGYVFQTLALFPHLTVKENVEYGLAPVNHGEREDRVNEILGSFHIAHLARHRSGQISGGERQRVALARSLVTQPRALLLDEPLSALDHAIKGKIMADLLAWNERHPIPVLYVTHAIEEAFTVGDRVIVLDEGRAQKQGRPVEVLAQERDDLIQQLSSTRSSVDFLPR